jgi:hypothetical protein
LLISLFACKNKANNERNVSSMEKDTIEVVANVEDNQITNTDTLPTKQVAVKTTDAVTLMTDEEHTKFMADSLKKANQTGNVS